jgi:hypothetical protein
MPSVFISYSRETKDHNAWVIELARRLRSDGIASVVDEWEIGPGDSLTYFMEQAVANSDFVILVCTPSYKKKFDDRTAGAGYEAELIAGQALVHRQRRKFIPVLRGDEWATSAPMLFLGLYYVDLRGDLASVGQRYRLLTDAIHNRREGPPPVVAQGLTERDDGTVRDESTGLIWYGCRDTDVVDWRECEKRLERAGASTGWQWRLPSEEEVKAMIALEEHYTRKPVMAQVECQHPMFGRFHKTPWTNAKRSNVTTTARGNSSFFTPVSVPIPGFDPHHAGAELADLGKRFIARFVRATSAGG